MEVVWSCSGSCCKRKLDCSEGDVIEAMLQIIILMSLSGITAVIRGAKLSEGVFVGSLLSMASMTLYQRLSLKISGD